LDKSITATALKRRGMTFETREAVPLSTGRAFLVIGRQEIDKMKVRKWVLVASSSALTALVTVQIPEPAKALYPDAAIRAALTSLTIRAAVPIEEELGVGRGRARGRLEGCLPTLPLRARQHWTAVNAGRFPPPPHPARRAHKACWEVTDDRDQVKPVLRKRTCSTGGGTSK
jgi:hypothetical protein